MRLPPARVACAAWLAISVPAHAAPSPPAPPAPAQPAPDVPIDLQADRLEMDEAGQVLTATGHVVLERDGMRLEAEALRYERRSGRGEVAGPLKVTGPAFEVTAERATFDLAARVADLYAFKGRWTKRGQFEGLRLRLSEDLIELETARGTTCMHADPDLALAAKRFRYYPKAQLLNFTASGVALHAFGRELVALPELNTTLDDKQRPGFDDWIFPAFAFDAYQGFLTSTRFDFTFGEGSRGAIPVVFSTGRGISAGIEHALGVGPGEVLNSAKYETPWATGQGGLRVGNGYTWRGRDGSRYEIAADYRANLNEQAVHRLPEASWVMPAYRLGPLSVSPELRAGYLWEESTNVQTSKLRAVAPFTTRIWMPVGGYQTWVDGAGFANQYGTSRMTGGVVTWHHREDLPFGLGLSQALETVRVEGQTPYVHDRLIGADRIRLGFDRNWGPRFTTIVAGSWSRLFHQGPLLPEELGVTGIYRWNCFSFALTVRPLIWGVDTRFQLLEL